MTDELPEGADAPDTSALAAPAEPAVAGALPASVNAAAVLLISFGMLAALGTALALLATLSSRMRHYSNVVPHYLRDPMNGPIDGPWGPLNGPMGGQFGDPMGGMVLVPDGGHVLVFGLLAVLLVGLVGGAIAGAHIAAGLAILQRRAWGRLLGLAGSVAALIVLLMGLTSTLLWASVVSSSRFGEMPRHMDGAYPLMGAVLGFGTVVTLLMIATYAFVLWALARHRDAFD